jgi:hypothetical protein
MILNMLTVNRPGQNYLDRTLESLRASDWSWMAPRAFHPTQK